MSIAVKFFRLNCALLLCELVTNDACIQETSFHCLEHTQCKNGGVTGRCEITGFCSFSDASCESGYRYGELSGKDSKKCVDVSVTQSCVETLYVGVQESCIQKTNDTVLCWGEHSGTPHVETTRAGFHQLALGGLHSCALDSANQVWCWGDNSHFQLGSLSPLFSEIPIQVSLPAAVRNVSVGYLYTCATLENSEIWCWGYNAFGQLGDGATTADQLPQAIASNETFWYVTAGADHACGLTTAGAVWCWGRGEVTGSLGNGVANNSSSPVLVNSLPPAVAVAAAKSAVPVANESERGAHTCAIDTIGDVYCWGANFFGEVGANGNNVYFSPQKVAGITNAQTIDVGLHHSCALVSPGDVWCWGSNKKGQLGNAVLQDDFDPILLNLGTKATQLRLGALHSCAVLEDSSVRCMGYNANGQLGNETPVFSVTPRSTEFASTTLSLGVDHLCGADPTGNVACWGSNLYFELSDSELSSFSNPITLPTLLAQDIASARRSNCLVATNGEVWCWGGYNAYGELGYGSLGGDETPKKTLILASATRIAGGTNHYCAIQGGTVYCWGRNFFGEVGDNTIGNQRSQPTPVTGSLTGVAQLAAGEDHSCALTDTSALWCWGSNFRGQLGTGSADTFPAPLQVPITNVAEITARGHHSCARKNDGTVWCWGDNTDGQLGVQPLTDITSPVQVGLPNNAASLSTGDNHTCAVLINNEIWCWGDNAWGQLGRNDVDRTTAPILAFSQPGVVAIEAGSQVTCIVLNDQTTRCWGRDNFGQLGYGRSLVEPIATVAISCP